MNEFETFTKYMNKNTNTANEEDYIEMIYRLKDKEITNCLLANNLNIKPSSITKMINKLINKGLIVKENNIFLLTNRGSVLGKKLIDRHNIIEEFIKNIGISVDIIEKTEKIEHTIDDEILKKLYKINELFNKYPFIKRKIVED